MKTYALATLALILLSSRTLMQAEWVQTNEPYRGSITCLVVSCTNLFAGTFGGVWRRPVEITSVREIASDAMPRSFELKRNYPNPFNLTTTIESSLPNSSEATLKIFDILGREITTLVSEQKSLGTYTVQWDASGVSGGLYCYRLQAGEY